MDNLKMMACFDKKLTDYQISVERQLQDQNKELKSYNDYVHNTLDSQNKRITDFMEENAGGGASANFVKVYENSNCDGVFSIPSNFFTEYTEFILRGTGGYDDTIMVNSFARMINGSDYLLKIKVNGGIVMIYHILNNAMGSTPNVADLSCTAGGDFIFADKIESLSGYGECSTIKLYAR